MTRHYLFRALGTLDTTQRLPLRHQRRRHAPHHGAPQRPPRARSPHRPRTRDARLRTRVHPRSRCASRTRRESLAPRSPARHRRAGAALHARRRWRPRALAALPATRRRTRCARTRALPPDFRHPRDTLRRRVTRQRVVACAGALTRVRKSECGNRISGLISARDGWTIEIAGLSIASPLLSTNHRGATIFYKDWGSGPAVLSDRRYVDAG